MDISSPSDTSSSLSDISSEGAQKVSELFCDVNADISFLSSDGVIFKLYGENLTINTSVGFAKFSSTDTTCMESDSIPLEETADVLEILFQFIEPPSDSRNYRQPSMHNIKSKLFFAVAEAAEKYVVYGAASVCIAHIRQLLCDELHPLEVLNHCAKHGYPDLADQAAEQCVTKPLDIVALKLTAPGILITYLTYLSKIRRICDEAITQFTQEAPMCHVWTYILTQYILQLEKNPLSIDSKPEILDRNIICNGEAKFLQYPDGTSSRVPKECKILDLEKLGYQCSTQILSSEEEWPEWFDEVGELRLRVPKFSTIKV